MSYNLGDEYRLEEEREFVGVWTGELADKLDDSDSSSDESGWWKKGNNTQLKS